MSEPVSAFAAYRGTTSKGHNTSKKGHNKKAGANANKKNAAKNKSLQKDKPEIATKNQIEPKSGNAAKEKLATVSKAKEVVKNKTAPRAEPTKNKPTSSKAAGKSQPQAKQKQKHAQHAATNGKAAANGINENEIDNLVEQLLGDSPSKPKKLTKAQQKKKQELEDYLVKQLARDDEAAGEEDFDSETGSEEDYSSGSDEFSDEYTINSYSDEEEEEEEEEECEEEETSFAADYSSESGADEQQPIATSTANVVPQKRKGNEATSSRVVSEATEPKKARQAEKAADKRKSMPANVTTTADNKAATKTAEKRRHSIAEKANEAGASAKITVKTVDAKAVKMEPLSPPNNVVKMNSIQEGEKIFSWLLSPLNLKEFFSKYWETGACLVKRKGSNYYTKLISFEAIDQMLINNHVEFTKNIDITSYKNGVRETLNPVGRAMPPVVWDHYGQGCSVRLLNPHTFLPELFKLNTTLQEYFHCLVGANAYLTPPNSQGFAPHYDDIEAFVLQIEGRKRWRLYKPRTQSEQLPRFSSKNFTQQEIGQPIFDEVLEPGDLLYFPRGTIHQAITEPGHHSLHITLSVYQKQSYADLFERMMPLVLQRAIESNLDMRRGLPLHTFQHAGIAYSDNDTKERADLLRKVTKLMGQCLHSAQLGEVMDAAVDQLAKKYHHEALPPHVLPAERARTIFGSRSATNAQGECMCDYEIDERTNVRLLRANIMRLVQEEEKVRIYYYLDNSKEYCEYEPNFIEIEPEEAASVEVLIRSYPQYVGVSQLPLEDDERKVQMVTALWERGLLMTEKPFK